MGYSNLKDLIKAVRNCKTLAEERNVIQKESANLRSEFRNENVETRATNVSKLLYIHMLGFPSHFGQIECLKLVASPRFIDKRMGYLGISMLIDENQETITLVTNSLKNDLNHTNMYITGLALSTIGSIASVEVSRDLTDEVEKLMENSNSYVRKKAALCAIRIINRVPDLYEQYVNRAITLLSDKSHGVMLTSVTLIEEICKIHPHTIDEFKQAVPILVRRLKTLATTSSFLPELDVSGVTDPFLQVKILKLLRTLGIDDVEASESMNDVLAQVATNTDSSKNAGNAILYETVLTVMDIESDSDLRLMAINILGKFLGNKDNNTRYVALTTLHRAVSIDLPAVQRHRDTILECLHDVDVSICRRALELTYALIDGENVRILMRELLAFLEVTQDPEVKADMAVQLCIAAEKFAPNRRWHIDTVVRVMRLAGNHVHEDIVSSLTRLIANSNELHLYSVSKLYQALKSDLTQESLVLVGVWILGELSNILTESDPISEDGEAQKVTCSEILDLMEQVYSARQTYPNTSVQQYLATSLAKLSVRFTNEPDAESLKQRITQLLHNLAQSNDVEVQQRALEYIELLKINPMYLAILEPMPSPKLSENSKLTARGQKSHRSSRNVNGSSTRTKKAAQQNLLLDLMMGEEPSESANGTSSSGQAAGGSSLDPLDGLFGSGAGPSSSSKPRNDSIMDLLGDLDLGQQPSTSSPPLPTSAPPQTSPQNDVFASFGTPESTPISQEYNVFENDGLKITMNPSKDAANPNVTNFETNFTTTNGSEITDLMLQIAVPKSQKIQMLPPSSTSVQSGGKTTQIVKIFNPTQAVIKLRLKVSFKTDSGPKEHLVQYSGFPDSLH